MALASVHGARDDDKAKKEVHEACFEFLSDEGIEMVDHVLRTSEKAQETAISKLERMGFRVGQRLAEKYSKEKPRFTDNLEVIKFICKEFWMELFKKQIDNLRTNHRGMYVLQENRFRPLLHLSTANKELSQTYTFFTCGVVRGALAAFGISVLVSAEVLALPACQFTIKIKSA